MSTADVANGKTDEDEVPSEKEEGQAQAAVALKKRKRAKSSVLVSPPKRKRPESFPLALGIQKVCINSALAFLYLSSLALVIRKRFSMSLMDLMKRR